jgi:hypothetical protein
VESIREKRDVDRILAGITEGTYLEDLAEIISKEILKKQEGMVWTGLMCLKMRTVPDCVNTVINLLVPQNAGNFLTCYGTNSFSRRTLLHGVSQSLSLV